MTKLFSKNKEYEYMIYNFKMGLFLQIVSWNSSLKYATNISSIIMEELQFIAKQVLEEQEF